MGSACSYECYNAQTQKNLERKKLFRISTIKVEGDKERNHLKIEFTEQSLQHVSADLLIVFVDSSINLARNKHFQKLTNEANSLEKRLNQKLLSQKKLVQKALAQASASKNQAYKDIESKIKQPRYASFEFPALTGLKFKYFSFVTCPIWSTKKKDKEEENQKKTIEGLRNDKKKAIEQLQPVVKKAKEQKNLSEDGKKQLDANIKVLQRNIDDLQHLDDKLNFGTFYAQLLRDVKLCLTDLKAQMKDKQIKSIAIAQFTENLGIPKKKGVNAVVLSILRSPIKPEWVKILCLTEVSKDALANHFDNAANKNIDFYAPSRQAASQTYN